MIDHLAPLCTSVNFCSPPETAENAPGLPLPLHSPVSTSLPQGQWCTSLFSQATFPWPAAPPMAAEGCQQFDMLSWPRVGIVFKISIFLSILQSLTYYTLQIICRCLLMTLLANPLPSVALCSSVTGALPLFVTLLRGSIMCWELGPPFKHVFSYMMITLYVRGDMGHPLLIRLHIQSTPLAIWHPLS